MFLSSDFPWSFLSLVLAPMLHPCLLTLQHFFHLSRCGPLIMFNSPPALPRLTSPCVIPLSALCFRLVLITPLPHHGGVWKWHRPDIQRHMRPSSVPSSSSIPSCPPDFNLRCPYGMESFVSRQKLNFVTQKLHHCNLVFLTMLTAWL